MEQERVHLCFKPEEVKANAGWDIRRFHVRSLATTAGELAILEIIPTGTAFLMDVTVPGNTGPGELSP